MSYRKAMKHANNPRRYKKTQPMLFSTQSGFWPSGAFLKNRYWPYLEECEKSGEKPLTCEAFYNKK